MNDEDSVQHSNIEESEMGQLHAIHLNWNAVAAVRARVGVGPSALVCVRCGDDIPLARRMAVAGCTMCIICKTDEEKM